MAEKTARKIGSFLTTPTSFVIDVKVGTERIQQSFSFNKYGGKNKARAAAEKFYSQILKDPRIKQSLVFGATARRNDVVKTFLNYLENNGQFDGREKLEKGLIKYRIDNIDRRFQMINKDFKEWRSGLFDVDGIDNAKARKNIEVKNWSTNLTGERAVNKETQLKFLDDLNNQPELSLKAVKNKFNKKFKNTPGFNKKTFIQRINTLTELKRHGSAPSNADGSLTKSYGVLAGSRSRWLRDALTENLKFNTNYNRLIRAADILQNKGETKRANRLYAAADDFFGSKGIFTKLPGNAEHPLSVIYGKKDDGLLKVDSLVRGDLNRFKNDAFDNPIKRLRTEYNKKGTSLARRNEIQTLMNNRKSFLNYLTSGSINKGIVEKVNFDFTPQKVSLTSSVTPVDELGRKFDFGQFVKKGEGFLDEFTKRGAGGNLLTAKGLAKRTMVSDTRIANLLKAVEKAPASCQKILSFQTGGISRTCAEAIIQDPVGSANKLQNLDAESGPLAKVKNAATNFLQRPFVKGAGKFGALAAVGAGVAAIVKPYMNDDMSTYLSDEGQQKNMLKSMILDPITQPDEKITEDEVNVFDKAYLPTLGAVTAAGAVPGGKRLFDVRKRMGAGNIRSALSPIRGVLGKGLAATGTPLGIAALEPLYIASQIAEGDSLGEIATNPLNYLAPAFMGGLSKEATRFASPLASKIMRLGASPAALKTVSRRFGLPGLALSSGVSAYEMFRNKREGRGLFDDG
jgi:hypothetical protein